MKRNTKINVAILIAVILTHMIIFFNSFSIGGIDNIKEMAITKFIVYIFTFIVPALLGLLCLPVLRKVHLITLCYVIFAVVHWLYWFYIPMNSPPRSEEDILAETGDPTIFWYFILNNILSAVFVLLVKLADVLITKAHNNAKQKKET